MDKYKLAAILCRAASLILFMLLILYLVDKDYASGIKSFCLGSATLYSGSMFLKEYKKNADNLEDKPEDHE